MSCTFSIPDELEQMHPTEGPRIQDHNWIFPEQWHPVGSHLKRTLTLGRYPIPSTAGSIIFRSQVSDSDMKVDFRADHEKAGLDNPTDTLGAGLQNTFRTNTPVRDSPVLTGPMLSDLAGAIAL